MLHRETMKKRRFFDPRLVPERRKSHIMACMLFWSVLSYLFVSHFILTSMEVLGDSMRPALRHGDFCILNRFIYRIRDPKRGDVVAVRVPGYNDLSVKRIVALPGETIHIARHGVQINAQDLPESYLESRTVTTAGMMSSDECVLAPDRYFLLGDNRSDSLDSRVFGTVPRKWIVGRVAMNKDHATRRRGAPKPFVARQAPAGPRSRPGPQGGEQAANP